jgi:hypothetical protein
MVRTFILLIAREIQSKLPSKNANKAKIDEKWFSGYEFIVSQYLIWTKTKSIQT